MSLVLGADSPRHIGEIEFFGYGGLDTGKIRAALPIREGAGLPEGDDAVFEWIEKTRGEVRLAVEQATGRAPTDVSFVCCDARRDWMIYIGLPGTSSRMVAYNSVPKGTTRFPPDAVTLFQQMMDAHAEAMLKGVAGEDDSKGYALSADPAARSKQRAIREYAMREEALIFRVLETCSDAGQRAIAAHFLGYARQSDKQIAGLVRAGHDANETVRNNAVRALGVLATSSPKTAGRIPAASFVEMLNSGTWTDRNKASLLLLQLSETRDERMLGQLRLRALDSLIEMARWRTGHADAARLLLGRIGGIEEGRLQKLADAGQVDSIVAAAQKAR